MLEKKRNSVEFAPRIKILSKSIGEYFANDKAARVRSTGLHVSNLIGIGVNSTSKMCGWD